MNILITGATGNIGSEVLRFLFRRNTSHRIFAGVRNIEKAEKTFANFAGLAYVYFDFEDSRTFEKALSGIDIVFLLRPPHISDVNTYFRPLLTEMKNKNIKNIVFLSVQGAEKSKIIPHNKIERLISNEGFDYIFLRPSYFMQNLTTTLLKDIKENREIILPAGKARFNWVDIKNISEAGAILLEEFDTYKNQSLEITGPENKNFQQVTELINTCIKNPIKYRCVNPVRFYRIKKRYGMERQMIIVMILLHFLPRFQNAPKISDDYEKLTGKKPTRLSTFIKREQDKLE